MARGSAVLSSRPAGDITFTHMYRADVFGEYVHTTIKQPGHPFDGKPFLHAFLVQSQDREPQPVKGYDGLYGAEIEEKNLCPDLEVGYAKLEDGTQLDCLQCPWSFQMLKNQSKREINLVKGSQRVIADILSRENQHTAVQTPEGSWFYFEEPDVNKAAGNGSCVLIVSTGRLTASSKSLGFLHEHPAKALLPEGEDGVSEERVDLGFVAPDLFGIALVVMDEAHQNVNIETTIIGAHLQYSIFLNTRPSRTPDVEETTPLVLLAGGSPFPSTMKQVTSILSLLLSQSVELDRIGTSLGALEKCIKNNQSTRDAGDVLYDQAKEDTRQALETAFDLVKRVIMARTYGCRITDNIRGTDPRPAILKHIVLNHVTPEAYTGFLKSQQAKILNELNTNLSSRAYPMSAVEKVGGFNMMLKAAFAPPILEDKWHHAFYNGMKHKFPITADLVKLDMPPSDWALDVALSGSNSRTRDGNNVDKPRMISRLARSAELARDPWYIDLLAICRQSRLNKIYRGSSGNTDGPISTETDDHGSRDVAIFCTSPMVTVLVCLFLRHHLADIAEVVIMTADVPNEPGKRTDHIAKWQTRLEDLKKPPGRPVRKIMICVLSVDIAGTGIDNLKFASVAVLFGEPNTLTKNKQALARIRRPGQERQVIFYSFNRTDNAAYMAVLKRTDLQKTALVKLFS
ncbi:hypothetical protein FPOAC2_10387 [Fusarium poae]